MFKETQLVIDCNVFFGLSFCGYNKNYSFYDKLSSIKHTCLIYCIEQLYPKGLMKGKNEN